MDVQSYILSKKYVEDSLAGAGALKGKSAFEIAQENGFKGTSSDWLATLRGDTPEIGPNGTWVISGKDTGVVASPSLAGYATEEFVNQQIANIPEIDLTPYATRKELNEAILGIVIPDVSNFVTQEDIDRAIAAIKFPEPDLTPYAKKSDIPDVSGFVTQEELQEAVDNIEHPVVDLSEYAKKDELPSLAGLATEQFVQDKIGEIEFPSADLTGYATEEYVRQKIAEAQMSGDVEVDLSDYYTKTEIDSKFDNIDIPEVDLKGLATESYVDDAIANIEHPTVDLEPYAKKTDLPSLEGLATESYVDNKVANLINAAPETLDTLGEVAAALAENQDVVDALNASISNKANKDEIPSIEGFATEEFVENKIAGLEVGSGQVSMEALTEAEILAIISSTTGGTPVTPSGQVLAEMTVEDVRNIIKG